MGILCSTSNTEVFVLSKGIIGELEERQRVMASFNTGLPRAGGNIALTMESGLLLIETRYHIELHRYFGRVFDSSSDLMQSALVEHKNATWSSPYKEVINQVINKYSLESMTKASGKQEY